MKHFLDKAKDKLRHEMHNDRNNGGSFPGQQQPMQQPMAAQQPQQPLRGQDGDLAHVSQGAIDMFFLSKQDNGEIGGIGYWQTANGYTAVVLYDVWSNTNRNRRVLEDQINRVTHFHPNLINEFNDDTLWWAQCCMAMYELTSSPHYLDIAIAIWNHVSRSVVRRGAHNVHNMDMGGGVFWTTKPGEDALNAITTGLFAELSALLATLPQGHHPRLPNHQTLVTSARASLDWITRCRYRAHDAIVTDTIKLRTSECVDWTFTYNTGALLSACVATYTATRDHQYVVLGSTLARAAMSRDGWVDSNGVLTEAGAYGPERHKAHENNDAVGFKSVLLRALAKFYIVLRRFDLDSELAGLIAEFVRRNYRAVTERDTNGRNQYGPWWNGPMDLPTSHSQMAVLDVFAAVAAVGGI